MINVSPELTYQDVIIRVLCSLAVGFIIGFEREKKHHIAGTRTHMLVSLGACITMMTNNVLFNTYNAYGATPDPGRLGAAIISGIGFIGAGTIVHDKFSTKGLTTAAGILTVASLGLASGAGFWEVAVLGAVIALVILKILAKFQTNFFGMKVPEGVLLVECEDVNKVINMVGDISEKSKFKISNMKIEDKEDIKTIKIKIIFEGVHQRENMLQAVSEISKDETVKEVSFDYGNE